MPQVVEAHQLLKAIMPANNGKCPPFPLVDLQFRNGWVLRNVDPAKFRWKSWDTGESAGDVVKWQVAKGGDWSIEVFSR